MPQQFGEPQGPDPSLDSTFVTPNWFYRRRVPRLSAFNVTWCYGPAWIRTRDQRIMSPLL